jgi:DNA-binding CsgD family transcriptional regulator
MKDAAQAAWEIIRSHTHSESIYYRIGRAVTAVIASDVSAIEVFDRNGDYAERRWSDAEVQISGNFEGFLANRFSHPLFREFVVSGLRNPVRISDCTNDRGFRATGMFNEFFRPLGISKQMAVALPSDSIGTPVLALARSTIDYTLEEKSVLRELLPKMRRQIAAEQTWGHYDLLIRRAMGAEAGCIALVSFHEYLIHAASEVFDLLNRYFPSFPRNRDRLPRQIVQLLRSRSGTVCSRYTFSSEETDSSLQVTVCDSENGDQQILSFSESEAPHRKLAKRFDLSPRLVDVLQLMEEGRSNKEIAGRLGLSPNTVRTLVEKVLRRMGVPNRTQAASMARKCLDGQ